MKIRQVDEDDIEAVQRLMHELGYPLKEEELRCNIHVIHKRGGVVWIAEVEGAVAGCLTAVINAGLAEGMYGEVVSLVVSREMRGSGIGRRLIEHAEDWLKPQVKKVRIRANAIRLEAHGFYTAMGYLEIKKQISFLKSI